MPSLLLIETSSDVCSVAVANENGIVASLQNNSRDHAALLASMIGEVMQQSRLVYSDLSCIGINGGPGSYTGLRIGLSTAKGLCYAASLPLVMVDALLAYANGLVIDHRVADDATIIATVENRRDELFYSVYDAGLNRLNDVALATVSDDEFKKRLGGKCVIVGSAVNKVSKVFPYSEALRYVNVIPSAVNLWIPVVQMFNKKQCADLAYSEPFYYKEVYIATKKA